MTFTKSYTSLALKQTHYHNFNSEPNTRFFFLSFLLETIINFHPYIEIVLKSCNKVLSICANEEKQIRMRSLLLILNTAFKVSAFCYLRNSNLFSSFISVPNFSSSYFHEKYLLFFI